MSVDSWPEYRFELVSEWKWFERRTRMSAYDGPHGPVHIDHNADLTRVSLSGPSIPLASVEWGPKQLWPNKHGKNRYSYPSRSWSVEGEIGGSLIVISQEKPQGNAKKRSLRTTSDLGSWTFRPTGFGTLWRVSGEQLTSRRWWRRNIVNPGITPAEVALVCLITASGLGGQVIKEWLP